MKRIPSQLTIKGKLWTVGYKWNLRDVDGSPADGLCLLNERKILLDRALTAEERPKIFLHELNHAILCELHAPLGDGIEEVVCDGMAAVYLDLFNIRLKN